MKKNTVSLQIICYLFISYIAFAQTPTYNPIDPHWQLVWEDHFNSLDTKTRWKTLDTIPQFTVSAILLKENVYILNGNLVLRVNNNKHIHNGTQYKYTNGKIETISPSCYDTQYGYLEAKMSIPYRKGLCCSFWTYVKHNAGSNSAEIDIVETFGGRYPSNKIATTNVHTCYPSQEPNCKEPAYLIKHEFVNSTYVDWHTYAIEWNKNRIIFYIDGKAVRTFSNHGVVDPVRLIFSILLEPNYLPPTSGSWSEQMLVDYVRVYTLKCDNIAVNEISNFNTYNYAVKKSITMSNATTIPANSNITLRATDFIELKPGFSIDTGRELYLDVTPCTETPLQLPPAQRE